MSSCHHWMRFCQLSRALSAAPASFPLQPLQVLHLARRQILLHPVLVTDSYPKIKSTEAMIAQLGHPLSKIF